MRLRDRPIKLLAIACAATIAVVLFGTDLMDGEVMLRALGRVSLSTTPVQFWLTIAAYLVAGGFTVLAWFVVVAEWRIDYRRPVKPPFEDETHRRRLEP